MAIPVFGFFAIEMFACALLVLAGGLGLFLTVTGQVPHYGPWLPETTWNPGRSWLMVQSVLVIAGGIGAWRSRSFTLALVGIGAGLIFMTPVGSAAAWPALLLLCLVILRLRTFRVFAPKRIPAPLEVPGDQEA